MPLRQRHVDSCEFSAIGNLPEPTWLVRLSKIITQISRKPLPSIQWGGACVSNPGYVVSNVYDICARPVWLICLWWCAHHNWQDWVGLKRNFWCGVWGCPCGSECPCLPWRSGHGTSCIIFLSLQKESQHHDVSLSSLIHRCKLVELYSYAGDWSFASLMSSNAPS